MPRSTVQHNNLHPPPHTQDKAKPRPFHSVNRVVRCELGASAEEVFAEFSAEATAAASLAQVCLNSLRLHCGGKIRIALRVTLSLSALPEGSCARGR